MKKIIVRYYRGRMYLFFPNWFVRNIVYEKRGIIKDNYRFFLFTGRPEDSDIING